VLDLFDPPPLVSMTLAQKVWRVALLSGTLVVGSILVAMLGALGLFIMEKGRELDSTPEFLQGLLIIIIGVCVNAVCVIALYQMKKADHKVVPRPDKSTKRVDPDV
jgi:biotin transporter BioY